MREKIYDLCSIKMSIYQKLLCEFLGTLTLVYFGNSSVANELLPKTKSAFSLGFGFISLSWGVGATIAILCFGHISAAINPAVSFADYLLGRISLLELLSFSLFQTLGGFVGSCLVFLNYYDHYRISCVPETHSQHSIHTTILGSTTISPYAHPDTPVVKQPCHDYDTFKACCDHQQSLRLLTFCTKPAIKHLLINALTECIGTFILVVGINLFSVHIKSSETLAIIVGGYVFLLVATHGGTTGFGCNPARDLGPRLAHFILPISGKGKSEFSYGMVVVLSNLVGGALGGVVVGELLKGLTI
jgi:glycerol uptake facilitator protein